MLRSMGPSWAMATPPAAGPAVRAAPVSPPIEHTETGESDCILAAKLRGLWLGLLELPCVGVGETEAEAGAETWSC